MGILLIVVGLFTANYINEAMNYKVSLLNNPKDNEHSQDYMNDIGTESSVINILFLGIDRTKERDNYYSGHYRSDTIAIARIDLDSKMIKILSIPRDTYTYIPIQKKMDKITHAYLYGTLHGNGINAAIESVNHFLDKNIVDYYFVMDMGPIPSIVDEIGGVELDVEIDMKTYGANLNKGLQVLNGQQAFDYVHWRFSTGGDIDRIKRQHKFISALYKQQRESGKILETLNIVLRHKNEVKTDFTMKQLIGLSTFMSHLPNGNITYYTIPGNGKTINNVSYWVHDKKKTEEVLMEFYN